MHHRSDGSVESIDRVPLHIHRLLVRSHVNVAGARWWLSIPVALLCLFFLDNVLALWNPHIDRLPEQFSAAFLQRYVDEQHARSPVLVLGDSVLWGYKIGSRDAAATLLKRRLRNENVVNLSYEGGSSANTYFMLRYALSRGVRPRAVIFNINSKETNPADSAYKRLHPSLERLVLPLLSPVDRKSLKFQPEPTISGRLDEIVSRVWRLYRYRVDLRQALFGHDDAATALRDGIQNLTGSARLQYEAHRPTADRFLGTYDLGVLDSSNVDFFYLKKLTALLRRQNIPAIAVLTPTNHRLLHDYIDAPEYDAKLRQMAGAVSREHIKVLNLDRAIPASEFIDNDHLTPQGNKRFESLLESAVRREIAK